ncbi:MAG TPA: glycosyltransferase family 4 protein [Propionibacteriaceae bacterium]|jgi:glycosyltransferase involved in cell wall biosynthesis|nr:glycosyltransferase family 4 protein [Propionibacteriaceae bacterium]
MTRDRPIVVVVAEAAPMRGGIATFAETITADPGLASAYEMRLLNTARVANREGGRFNLTNVRQIALDVWQTFRAARTADLVHLQLVADPGLPMLRAAALNLAGSAGRARLVAHVHSAVGNAGRPELAGYSALDRLALRTLRRAQLVCTVSAAGTATMRAFAGRTPVRTVDNAIDVAAFTPTRPDRTPPTVLFVGVVCRRKGTLQLARAARRLRERGLTEWHLVVVGGQGPTPEPEYAEIVAEFRAAGLADSLVGPEHGPQVRDRLRDADIFVLPSFLEGQPIAIIEAMAAGVPVVSTTVGAIPDLVRDGIEGRVVEPGDVDALAAALAELITQPDLRARMGAATRERAEAAHSLPQLSRSLSGLYATVLGRSELPDRPASELVADRPSEGVLR